MRAIEFEWSELGIAVTAELADDKNPAKCDVLWKNLPIHTVQSHAFSSGERMYAPCRIVSDVADEWLDPRSRDPKIGHWEETFWGRVPVKPGLVLANKATRGDERSRISIQTRKQRSFRNVHVVQLDADRAERLSRDDEFPYVGVPIRQRV